MGNLSENWQIFLYHVLSATIIGLVAVLINAFAKGFLVRLGQRLVTRTRSTMDDFLVEHSVFTKLSHLAPALAIWWLTPVYFGVGTKLTLLLHRLTGVYCIVALGLALYALLDVAAKAYQTLPVSRRAPITGYVQFLRVLLFLVVVAFSVSAVSGVPPWVLFSGASAITVGLMVSFKGSLANMAAAMQLAGNNMLHKGDWVEVPKHGAKGSVEEITFSVVKLRDSDNTMWTVPTADFIAGAFHNSRKIIRRILRTVRISKRSVVKMDLRWLTELAASKDVGDIVAKIRASKVSEEIRQEDGPISRTISTNLGLFRLYLEHYISNHPDIRKDKDVFVRLLEDDENGVPLQISCYTNEAGLIASNRVQSEIFEHIFVVMELFRLNTVERTSV